MEERGHKEGGPARVEKVNRGGTYDVKYLLRNSREAAVVSRCVAGRASLVDRPGSTLVARRGGRFMKVAAGAGAGEGDDGRRSTRGRGSKPKVRRRQGVVYM